MTLPTLIALVVLVVGVPLNLYVTVRLWRLARAKPNLRVVRDRAIVSTAVLLLVVVFSGIFLSNDQKPPLLPLDVTKIVTRLVVLAVAVVPAAYWAWVYRGWR